MLILNVAFGVKDPVAIPPTNVEVADLNDCFRIPVKHVFYNLSAKDKHNSKSVGLSSVPWEGFTPSTIARGKIKEAKNSTILITPNPQPNLAKCNPPGGGVTFG